MKSLLSPIVTGAATLFVLASAAALAPDVAGPLRDFGVERTVALAEPCGEIGCSIAYKTDDGGPPSRVLTAR
jgi:hypothetical protein